MFKLVIETEDGEVTVVHVPQDEITIGRNDSNTICLTEQNVSRRHARLFRENGASFVEDTNSANGILLNGNPLSGRSEVRDGDHLQIGDYLIGLRPQGQAAALIEDTDRIVAGGARPEAPAAPATKPPRLVLTSVGFEGKEVRLEQDVIVVGRAVDNDLILEHWSIWPHHARLFRDEHGAFSIEDLRGPNSVRINGKSEERAELHDGDIIELGQIQMRFVGAGEDFVYRPPRAPLSRQTWWLAGCLFTLVMLVTLATLKAVFRTSPPEAPPAAEAPKAEAPAVVFARQLGEVDSALKAGNWMAAIDLCKSLEPQDVEGQCASRRKQAESEQAAKTAFLAFRDAAERSDTDLAVAKYQSIPEDSTYKGQAQVLWPVVRDSYSKQYLAQATKAAGQGRCDEARGLGDLVAAVDPENEGLAPIRRRCPGPTRVATADPARPRPTPTAARPKPTDAPATPAPATDRTPGPAPGATGPTGEPAPADDSPPPAGPTPAEQAAALVAEAQVFFIAEEHRKVVLTAQKALKLQPGDPIAVRMIGMASCNLKDKAKAAWAYERLNVAARSYVASLCLQHGITLP